MAVVVTLADHSHDQQASLSMKTKKRRWQMNDDEAPLKRLAREIPRFNWLEDKIKNSSQTCSSQLVKETKTEKSVKTMDNSSVLKKKVISNSKFDENISGAAQSRSLYMKTYDTKSNFKDIEKSMETVENGSDHKEKNTSEQWQTFYKETDVLPQTGCEKKSSNLPANQLLPYEPSDQSVPSDDQKQEKSIISPPPLLYRHTPSPVLKIQQELTMNPMEPTNSKTLNMDEVLTKNAKDNFQAMISTLDQDLQQETSIVHKDLGSSSSKFRSIRPKIDPIFISRKPFFSFTKPTEAEYYIPKLATEEFNGFESLRKRGSINTMCSVQDSVSKQGEKVDSQFGSKDSSLTEDDVYERESHKLGSLRLYEHDSNTSYINCSSVKSITSFPSSNKIEAPTADDLTDYSKETMENDTKLNHTVSKDIVLSSERLVKTTDLDGHLPRDNSKGHLHEYICPSVTYDVVAQGSTKGSVVLQQNEHTASHTLANSNKFKTPVTSHDDISFKQITFSESKQKTGQHSSRFQVTKSSPLNQTLESKSSPQNDQSWKELSSPVQSQGNNLTYQHTSKHYHSEAMSGSDSRNNSDFSQSNEDSSACNEHQQKQFNQQWNVHDGKSKGIIWKDSDVLSEHMNKQEDSAVQLLRRTSNITSLSPKVPNMSAHSIELKLQAIQTFDENSKGLPINSFTSVEEIQHVISDDQFSRNNSINTPEKLANQHRNPLVDNICHLRKEISGHKENNFYKSKACRLEKDSLNSSNSAGYLSLKRKRLLNYAMDREREIAENQEDETKFGMEKTENSIDDTTKPSLKPQLHNEKIENAIEDNEIQVIFEIDKTEITHQNNNDHFLKLASSDTKLAPCEIVENWSDKNENLQDKPVSCVENSQNQSITRLVGSSDEPKKILVIESLAQKHRNKKQSVNRKSQTESGLAESPNIPININDSPKRSTSPSFFIETYETSFDKRQNECSFVTKERHCFRSLKEEMQTRKKELIILDNLAKQRENEYKELLRTRKEKYKLLLMLEQCFPKLHDSPPKLEHRNNKPIKNETLSIDKCTKETSHTLDKALDLHPEKAQEKPKNPVFNIESHSMETKSAIFNKGGFTNHHTSDTDTLSNLITANATISSRESDSDKRVVDASNLSWSIRDLKTKGVYSHMLSSTEINPLNSKPVPLVQPHASTTSPQMVPPVSIGNDLNSVLNSCLNTSKWTKHEQTSNREEGKNPIEKKITFPSATAVVPVTDSSFNLSEMSSVKQPSISNLDHHAFYRNHMTSLSNFYSTHPSFQSNFIGEQKNTNCEVCERITGCSANKHNPDVCFSRYYVQHQNSIKRHEHKNENRNQNLTVRPNMFPHHTAINPLLIAPLGEPNKVVHSFRQESTEKLRTSPENLHRSYNQNFITSNQNIGSRMPVTQRSEVTMNNCRSPDVSSLTRLMPMMSSNRSRMNVRPLIQQFPHHTVQQYRDVSNIINPQALSSENPLQSAWPQQQMMVNYPLSQSLEYLSKDTKVMEKHHSIFNSNHQSQSSNPHCGFCGKKAIFMCSGCKQNWYCGEPCQVKHWPTHSRFCRNLNHCV
ncbi:uncharacterized protein LOC143222641 isoform X2 [Tachypleus tridentatus]|uniref:uncharacterized protein LOC143222641 isoform X2 n=1 Tax=Tachypleus tridentatus TaxID=6853 RepID=UPI003FCF4FD2